MTDTTTIKTETDPDSGLLTVDTGPLGFDPFGEKFEDHVGKFGRGDLNCIFCGRKTGKNSKTVTLDDCDHTVVVVRDEAGRAETNRIIEGAGCSGAIEIGAWEVGSPCHKKLAAALAEHKLFLL